MTAFRTHPGDNTIPEIVLPDLRRIEEFRRLYLGDWKFPSPALYTLAETACYRYDRRCDLSEEPGCPQRSRPGMPTFLTIRREEIDRVFPEAQDLGFEGDMAAWRQFVYECRPNRGGRFEDPWKGHPLEAIQPI